jgi:hypothetical protein
MQANILSLTKYASRPLIFFVLTPGSFKSTASICALRIDSGELAVKGIRLGSKGLKMIRLRSMPETDAERGSRDVGFRP